MAQAKEAKEAKEKEKQVKKAGLVVEAAPAKKSKKESEKKDQTTKTVESLPKTLAKAGKRSAKAEKEVEEKQAKEARKTETKTKTGEVKKQTAKPPRSKGERAGKKYREAAKLIEKDKIYSLAEALELATKTSTVKFDASVELHVNLGVDPRQADQNVRGTVALPAGLGKKVRVAVFAEVEDEKNAQSAGAEITGIDQISAALDKEQMDFDVLIATPATMSKLAKYAKLLGPKGLMPNPKSGTVASDVSKAVKEAKAGKVEFRVDSAGIIHLAIGKASFGPEKLMQNAQIIVDSIKAAKPASLKSIYIKSAYVSTTMGPSIKTEI